MHMAHAHTDAHTHCTHTYTHTQAHAYTHPKTQADPESLPRLHAPMASPVTSTTSTGSTSKGLLQYSLNMHTIVFSTTLALVRSVAVHSINTSRVFREICRVRYKKDEGPGLRAWPCTCWTRRACSGVSAGSFMDGKNGGRGSSAGLEANTLLWAHKERHGPACELAHALSTHMPSACTCPQHAHVALQLQCLQG